VFKLGGSCRVSCYFGLFLFCTYIANVLLLCLQHEWPQRLVSENVLESASELKEFTTIEDIIKQLQIEVCIFL